MANLQDLELWQIEQRVDSLENDRDYYKSLAEDRQKALDSQVTDERERIMRDATRRFETGKMDSTWVAATRQIPDTRKAWGLLHHRDPSTPPKIVPPTTRVRPRYLNGDIRDAGPGSHIGVALCGLPLLAEELWIRADHMIKAGANGGWVPDLCGMCSYLAGQPTVDAAWEAIKP